jgi:hypothetical protein
LALGLLVGAAGAAAPGGAQTIGRIDMVEIWAEGTPPGSARRPVYAQDGVVSHERLETGKSAAVHITLQDRTELRIGAGSSIVLDEFVFDPNAGTGRLVATVTRGIGRFVTGRIKGDDFQVRTPTATMGIRGTDFSVWVGPNGETTIWVNEGRVEVRPNDGAAAALVETGETVATPGGGGGVLRNAVRPPPDPGLRHRMEIQR